MGIRVVQKRLPADPPRSHDLGRADLKLPDPRRFASLSPRRRAQILSAIPRAKVIELDAIPAADARLVAWLQYYADRLERIGLLGSGELWVSIEPGAALPPVFATTANEHNALRFYRRSVHQASEAYLHATLIHELLHLGRGALPAPRRAAYFEEVVVEALATGLLARLRPELEDTPSYGGALGLPVLYTLCSWKGGDRRAFLEWLCALRSATAATQIDRCDAVLRRRLTSAQARSLARLYTTFDQPRRVFAIKSCARGEHGACGHSRSARFLHALGSEYAQFSIEHDPVLAVLRACALRYGENGLRREFVRWLRGLFDPA